MGQNVKILHQIILPCALLSIAGYTFMLATLLGIKALRTKGNIVIINLALSGILNHITYCFLAPVDPGACATQVRKRGCVLQWPLPANDLVLNTRPCRAIQSESDLGLHTKGPAGPNFRGSDPSL
jgi:hypothetical protein